MTMKTRRKSKTDRYHAKLNEIPGFNHTQEGILLTIIFLHRADARLIGYISLGCSPPSRGHCQWSSKTKVL